jgi:hypothetical protein
MSMTPDAVDPQNEERYKRQRIALQNLSAWLEVRTKEVYERELRARGEGSSDVYFEDVIGRVDGNYNSLSDEERRAAMAVERLLTGIRQVA